MRRITFIAAACAAIAVGAAVPAAAGEPAGHGYYFSGNAQDCEDEDFLEAIQGVSMNDLGETLIDIDAGESGANDIVSGTVHGDENELLSVELLDDSYVLTAVVVKGGEAYTLYLEEPWTNLHSPPLGNGQYPGISHWFACGYQDEEPTNPPTTEPPTEEPTEPPTEEPTETPSETPGETPSETPSGTPSESPSESPGGSPSDTPSPAPSDDDDLPDTGSSPTVLIGAALVLLAAGAIALRNRFVKA